jgi:hypothetical protein
MVRRTAEIAAGAAGLVALAGPVVAGIVVAGTGVAQAMPAKAATWHIVKQVRSGVAGDFTAVVATGKSTGWAFNGNTLAAPTTKPTAWRLKGGTWTRASFPGRQGEEAVATGAASPSDVWAFTDLGPGSRVLRWNGHTWSVAKAFGQPIGGASVAGGKDVWVFGQPEINQRLGVWHYNGHRWSRLSTSLDGGSALSATSVWAFRGTAVYHFNGHKWAKTSVARLLPKNNGLNDPLVTGIYAHRQKASTRSATARRRTRATRQWSCTTTATAGARSPRATSGTARSRASRSVRTAAAAYGCQCPALTASRRTSCTTPAAR